MDSRGRKRSTVAPANVPTTKKGKKATITTPKTKSAKKPTAPKRKAELNKPVRNNQAKIAQKTADEDLDAIEEVEDESPPPQPLEPRVRIIDEQIIHPAYTSPSPIEQRPGSTTHRAGWSNSTTVQPVNESVVDQSHRLIDAILETLSTVREASIGNNNSQFVSRLTDKNLPPFSGDPLEWLHFKRAFKSSTQAGAYSESENVTRLFNALSGDARAAVNTSLAATKNVDSIMRTLELQFGNKKAVAEKITAEIKGLPDLKSGKITLARLASKIRDATMAFKNLELLGYLYSPELIAAIGTKLPSSLKYAYNRHAATLPVGISELEKLSDFLYTEAELAASAGIFDNYVITSMKPPENRKDARRAGVINATVHNEEDPQQSQNTEAGYKKDSNCLICKEGAHHLSRCDEFKKANVKKRWDLIKTNELCFKCLKFGHPKNRCFGKNCPLCQGEHNIFLHKNEKSAKDLNGPEVINVAENQ